MRESHSDTEVFQQISYNTNQASVATGIAESTLRKLIREGRIAATWAARS